jgi:hypothetical protein
MKHALVITHVGSGGTLLCRILGTHYQVRSIGETNLCYDHPSIIHSVREIINTTLRERNEHVGWYVDKITNNYNFTCKPLYNVCKFIYMVRNPHIPLATLMQKGYPASGAENHYLFRLRRMCEMAVKTGGILLTYEDLTSKKAFPLLKNFLNLKSDLTESFHSLSGDNFNLGSGKILESPMEPVVNIPKDVLQRCSIGYKKYLQFLEIRTSLIRSI